MEKFVIAALMLIVSLSVKSAEVIPDEICGQWQTAVKQILRGDDYYDTASVVIRSDGLCPFWISPPHYPARIVLRKAEDLDKYFYQIEDQGEIVEKGLLLYLRTSDMLSFKIFGKEARFVRIDKLFDREREAKIPEQNIVSNPGQR